ncbi:MAG: hypothetical protein [Bacteriophage sp.]|nr:MAG: hypothetical protein [Bacteriophage sp.]
MKQPDQPNGETYARYASPGQTALVKWSEDANIAAMHTMTASTALSEASALRYATLSYEAPHVAQMITDRRERAIRELLKALEIIGYQGEVK